MTLKRLLLRLPLALLALYTLVYLLQLPFRSAEPVAGFETIAHRGVHQTFHREQLTNTTCTAERIDPPRHAFLENTLPSMRAALAAGANAIEIDLHASADGGLAVFHDWTVDCRTDGHGETRSHTLAQLRALDAGAGYTSDGGQSFPFRGQGVGLIIGFHEVLAALPDARFMLDQKDRSLATTDRIIAAVRAADAVGRVCLAATDEQNQHYREVIGPDACTFADRQGIKRCLIEYIQTGWTGQVPASCAGRGIVVPAGTLARLLWGWPGSFVERLHGAGSRVYVWTDAADVAHWQAQGFDGIITDYAERLAPP